MALASLTAAFTQYDAALAYDTDFTGATALSLCEAIRYILGHSPDAWSHSGRSFNRHNLELLLIEAQKFGRACSSSRPSMFVRSRLVGGGNGA